MVKSFFSNAQRGTTIILKGEFMINSSISDPNGRYCLINISHKLFSNEDDNMNSLTLANIYAPNNHQEWNNLFANLFKEIERFNNSVNPDLVPDCGRWFQFCLWWTRRLSESESLIRWKDFSRVSIG